MEKKIRILHIAQSAGGVDRYMRMLLKYVDKEKFENIFVCSQDFKKEDYEDSVIAFEQFPMKRSIGLSDLKAMREVRKLIRKYEPDIVYAHSSKAGAVARAADIGLKNFCIYNPHGWAFNMRGSKAKQMLYLAIEKMAAPFCEKIVCISDAEKQSALEKNICGARKLTVIFNGVDVEAYKSQKGGQVRREELGIPEDAFVVGMVGRISPQKAPDIFMEAAKKIKEKIPSAHFVIVGNGELEEQITEYAGNNGLGDVLHITGWVENPAAYVELFDVAVLLSRWEGFGLVLPEYMMAGKPVVASNVDAIPDVVQDGVSGLLVEADDPGAAAEAVEKIFCSGEMREELVKCGYETVKKRFDAKRMAYESEKLFLESAAKGRYGYGKNKSAAS
ncbi:MAG TPA: glycosyltransferase family 4 protein [Candidatus Blautia faecipullorum]|nr:glycosyltransferase family 4 protein [Candidatus Blautia faecipullorum]